MKTPEDEAFDELARKQGAWGGGFPAKRAMAADKLHWSDCAVHNGPAYPAGECDCGVAPKSEREVLKLALEALETERDIYCEHDEDGAPEYILDAITSIKVALAQPAQEPYDQTALELCNVCGWKTLIPDDGCLNCERKAQPAQEPVAWTLLLTGEHHGIIGEAGEKFIGAPECYQRVNVYTAPPLPVQPVREQWLQSVAKKIEAALLSHRLSLHKDAEDDGVGYPLVDALCCGQKSLEFGKREVEDIVETIYYVLDANTPPTPAAQPAQEPPSEWAGIKAVLDEYGLQAIDFVADFKAALAQPADNPYGYDWSMLEAAQESLREHMARIKELEAQLAQPAQDVDYWIREAMAARQAEMAMRRELEAQPAQEPVCAIEKPKLMLEKFLEMKDLLDDTTPPAAQPAQEPDMLTIAYQSGYHDGKKAALAGREWNFCERCGKRTADKTVIHTCTPPQEGT